MNAIQPSPNIGQPSPRRRRRPLKSAPRLQKRHPYQGRAVETAAKLAVNLVLSAAAISTLVQLLPDQKTQQEKLQEIRAEVAKTEVRVNRLRSEFSRNFDPHQTKKLMEEMSYRVDPTQVQIVWKKPKAPTAATP
ncbi:hypothetical protein [[Phormidium] sp. ETS-05]|uniref:slr1601 family putative cell division protein n=1 Tax=[Phormidium] sp. ETS-05 TaxID=222819 RepID=UPI0018EF0CE1|nr:hypothetical protein [[Phormidium] sp. ETS-05]